MALDVGTVWVNCWLNRDLRVPFGGTTSSPLSLPLLNRYHSMFGSGVKQSGIGREGGKFSLEFYTEKKTICVQYAPPQ